MAHDVSSCKIDQNKHGRQQQGHLYAGVCFLHWKFILRFSRRSWFMSRRASCMHTDRYRLVHSHWVTVFTSLKQRIAHQKDVHLTISSSQLGSHWLMVYQVSHQHCIDTWESLSTSHCSILDVLGGQSEWPQLGVDQRRKDWTLNTEQDWGDHCLRSAWFRETLCLCLEKQSSQLGLCKSLALCSLFLTAWLRPLVDFLVN